MRKVLLSVIAATTMAAGGCATLGRATFKEPVVQLRDVQLNGLGVTGGSMDVVLAVYNPNRFDLTSTRLTYNVVVDSVTFATGALDERITVQENDTTLVRIPISFTYAGIGAAGRQALNTGAVQYKVRGDVTVATPIGEFTRPYDQTGRFTVLRGTTP